MKLQKAQEKITYRTAVKIVRKYPRERWKGEVEKFTEFNEAVEK